MTKKNQREYWVDDVKVIACILVVLGHFFQSMTKANILPENDLYVWFNETIYFFHIPLFFIFLVTPTFREKKSAMIWCITAVICKEVFTGMEQVQAISYILTNEMWFAAGMWLCIIEFRNWLNKKAVWVGVGIFLVFVGLSILVYDTSFLFVSIIIGILGCAGIILIVAGIDMFHMQNAIFSFLSKYTMPIFLMHTLFAASLRAVLLKIGIQNSLIHVIFGITVSFVGPILAAWIMKKSRWLEFFLYPGKFIKIR